jgi:hypothetical protein
MTHVLYRRILLWVSDASSVSKPPYHTLRKRSPNELSGPKVRRNGWHAKDRSSSSWSDGSDRDHGVAQRIERPVFDIAGWFATPVYGRGGRGFKSRCRAKFFDPWYGTPSGRRRVEAGAIQPRSGPSMWSVTWTPRCTPSGLLSKQTACCGGTQPRDRPAVPQFFGFLQSQKVLNFHNRHRLTYQRENAHSEPL